MKITNGEIIALIDTINDIKQQNTLIKSEVGYLLIKNFRLLINKYNDIIEKRQNLLLKYGENQNNNIVIKKEFLEDFNNDFINLLNEINDINLFKIKLNKCIDINLSLQNIEGLYPIIEE